MSHSTEDVTVDTGRNDLDEKIREWLKWDRNSKTRNEVCKLLVEKNNEKLCKIFLNRIEFGTAGLRGYMGAGYLCMNDLIIIQTGQGLVEYLLEIFPDCRERGVVIGYDGRYNSRRFAELTTSICLNKDVRVYLFSDLCPTPFVPFAVTHYNAVCGVMVTASHNPKDDNGYKVYWSNGCQIISPHDKEIQKRILNNLEPLDSSWDVTKLSANKLVTDALPSVVDEYYRCLRQLSMTSETNSSSKLKITYTPMHGVGYSYMLRAFQAVNLPEFYVVEEQKLPDPEFSTVKFPNPEEGKSALNLAIKTADENHCQLIVANDPDSDRLAVAEKNINGDGKWKVFNGNELGALLGWWMLHCYQIKNPNIKSLENVYMLSSTVSSKILSTMSVREGFQFVETLTGFKWMGNEAHKLQRDCKIVLFAFEEAIGFMCGTNVLDKDGVSAGVVLAELANYLNVTHDMSLTDKLKDIYLNYGHHLTSNSYFFCYEPQVLTKIFNRLRNFHEENDCSYPTSILNSKYQVTGIRDLTTGYDDSQPDKKAKLPTSKSSQMITFKFVNGLVATLRTSGTEPKVKYYTELCADPAIQDVQVLRDIQKEMINGIIQEFLQPAENGLISRSE